MSKDIDELYIPEGKQKDGFEDPTGSYLHNSFYNRSSTSHAARGIKRNDLYIGGGHPKVNLELNEPSPSEYPYNKVTETLSGHSIEYDDTPKSERILIKHRLGSGIELRNDGTVIISSKKNTIRLSQGDEKVIIEGNGDIVYNGNLNLTVSGDMNLDVGGNFNVKTGADKKEDIRGNYETSVKENIQNKVLGNITNTIKGSLTNTVLTDVNNIIKGSDYKQANKVESYSATDTTITSATTFTTSSVSANIAAKKMALLGDSGTIGGANIISYVKNIYGTSGTYTAGVSAPTFHGSLIGDVQGVATGAIDANRSAISGPGGQTQNITNTATNTSQTIQPTNARVNEHLHKLNFGIRKVLTDPNNTILNALDKTALTNKTPNSLTTEEVRSKLREDQNYNDTNFIASQIGEGSLKSHTYVRDLPVKLRNAKDIKQSTIIGKKIIGNADGATTKKFQATAFTQQYYLPDPLFNPDFQSTISYETKLCGGIPISKFIGPYGDKAKFSKLTAKKKLQVARNLYLHAEILREYNLDPRYRLVVAEGLYTKENSETLTPGGIKDLATQGRAVVYEVRDNNGNINNQFTFVLATTLKDYINYDKLILDYDSFDGTLNSQIIILTPNVNSDFKLSFKNLLETKLNGRVQGSNEIVHMEIS